MISLRELGRDESGLQASFLAPRNPAAFGQTVVDHDARNGKGPRAAGAAEAACLVAVVESRSLLRDCISHLLLKYRDVTVNRFVTLDELLLNGSSQNLDLIILGVSNKSRQEALDEVSRLRGIGHSFRLIILADNCDPGFVGDALRLGAQGIVTTSSTADVAVEAFRLVMAGGTFIPTEGVIAVTRPVAANGKAQRQLTVREEQIIALLRCGKP